MSWLSSAWHDATDWLSRAASGLVETVASQWYDGTEWLEKQTGMTIEQIGLAVVTVAVTAATGGLAGFATVVGEGVLGAVGASAVAGETIVGSATVASVTGGTIIGAGTGAISGGAQAAMVGGDIGQGILTGFVVGAVGGGAGMLAAGAAQGVLAGEVANGTLSVNEAKALTNAAQRVTANTIGAAIQGRDIGTAAATGLISGSVTPLVQDLTGLGNVASATLGGTISGAGTSALQGTNVVTGALGGAASGAVGAAIGPTLEQQVRSILGTTQQTPTATPVSQEISSAPLSHQETAEILGYLNQVAAQAQANGLPEQEQAARQAIEAMTEYYRQNDQRFRTEDMMAMLGLGNVTLASSEGGEGPAGTTNLLATSGPGTTLTIGEGEADVTAEDTTPTKTFTQEAVPDDRPSQYYAEEGAAGQAVNPAQQEYEAYAKFLQENPYIGKIYGDPQTKFGADRTARVTDADIFKLISGDKSGAGNVTFTNVSTGTSGPTTLGNVTLSTGNAATGNATSELQPFGADLTRTESTTLQPFGRETEQERTTETTTTKKLPEPRVYTPPVYIDVSASRRAATAAPSPVRSAGLDPATSGVLLGKYGKKNQVWNEATLRLADALGIR